MDVHYGCARLLNQSEHLLNSCARMLDVDAGSEREEEVWRALTHKKRRESAEGVLQAVNEMLWSCRHCT
jgi:hypothetical protein